MIPVIQTQLGETGNCFNACLASLFEFPIEKVPNFFDVGGKDPATWWRAVRDWLRPYGFGVMNLDLTNPGMLQHFEGIFIVSGESERGVLHATLWENGKMIHDPHPTGTGILLPVGCGYSLSFKPVQLQGVVVQGTVFG